MKYYILLSIFFFGNLHAEPLVHLDCTATITEANSSRNFSTKGSVTIDASSGAVLEGTFAEGVNKLPTFRSTASETRFRGYIDPSKFTDEQIKTLKVDYLYWNYSFDRYSGTYNVSLSKRIPPKKRGEVLWDEFNYEENGNCKEIVDRKF